MSTSTSTAPTFGRLTAGRAARTGGVVLAVSVAANLIVYAVARLADADFLVTQAGSSETTEIGAAAVVFGTLLPLVVGTVALAIASRWDHRGWSVLAWLGLAIGVLTVVMPFSADPTAGTAIALALMHIVVGVVWFVALRRGVAAAVR